MKYENVIFDLYGTLVDIWTDENRRGLWTSLSWYFCLHQAKYTAAELKKAYLNEVHRHSERLRKEVGELAEINLVSVFEQLYLAKGAVCSKEVLDESVMMFRALSMKRLKVYDGVFDLLDALKKQGKKVYLLTNAQKLFTKQEIVLLNLMDYFDGVMYSSEEKIKKPNVNFYGKIIRKYDLDPEKSVMVGNDGLCDIEGALSAGLMAVHVHSNIEGGKPCPKGVLSIKVEEIDLLKNELLK